MRSAHARMYCTRIRHGLGGTDSLAKDHVTQRLAQSGAGGQVDARSEDPLEPDLKAIEPDQSGRTRELHQHVDIAISTGFVTGHRSEYREGRDAVLRPQFVGVQCNPLENLL